jgi:catechol 2,3-dioxygenase-like lactoylglutathione lyase family enzyme
MTVATGKNLGVKTIDHVTLVVADLERSRQFFAGLLGMEEKQRPDFGFPGLWFQAGSTQIHLNVESPDAGTAGVKYDAKKITRALHVAFLVDDANSAARILRERGVEIIAGPRNRPDGAIQLYILDPDGHQIEITSPA